MEKQLEEALLTLRQKIDKIDDQLISLFEQRMKIISEVGELKKNNKEFFFIRSAREADMIKDLVAKSDGKLPKLTIVNIWRKIITAANMLEQPLSVLIYNPKNIRDYSYLVREYYNNDVPILNFDSVTNTISEIKKDVAKIGVFALPNPDRDSFDDAEDTNDNWWINLANNRDGLKVFAKIPFVEFSNHDKNYDQINLVAVAAKRPEKSSSDRSLLYVELSAEFSKFQLMSVLKTYGIDGWVLKSIKLSQVDGIVFYLLDVNGFFDEDNTILETIKNSQIKPYVRVIGNYAKPIVL